MTEITPASSIARAYLEAAYSGDLAAAGALLADDIVLRMGGRSPLAGETVGKPAFLAAFEEMMRLTNGTYRLLEQIAWLEGDQHALLVAVEKTGVGVSELRFERAILYRVDGGLIRLIQVFEGQPEIAEAAFRSSSSV